MMLRGNCGASGCGSKGQKEKLHRYDKCHVHSVHQICRQHDSRSWQGYCGLQNLPNAAGSNAPREELRENLQTDETQANEGVLHWLIPEREGNNVLSWTLMSFSLGLECICLATLGKKERGPVFQSNLWEPGVAGGVR